MVTQHRRNINLALFVLFFLTSVFAFCFITSASAAGLEVQYPALPNTPALGAETKLPAYMLYLFNAGMLLGFFAVFISLAIAGSMYFLSPAKPDLLTEAKDRVGGAVSGLLILVLTYLIITTVNPQLSVFHLADLPELPPPPPEKKAPGVYFYKTDCADENIQPYTSNKNDLGDLKNKVARISTVQDPDTQTSYLSILYDNPGLWGKCQYITDSTCKQVIPFATSASVYKYNFKPDGDGVYFYRKSCFNNQPFYDPESLVAQCNGNSGGYYKVSNYDIQSSGIYISKLENLTFQNVPETEKACVGYDNNGECLEKKPQSLGGENVSSIIIKGNYLVLFIYKSLSDPVAGPWTSCQEFPTSTDTNKTGPQQIKWERIRNAGPLPNYIAIIPIQQ